MKEFNLRNSPIRSITKKHYDKIKVASSRSNDLKRSSRILKLENDKDVEYESLSRRMTTNIEVSSILNKTDRFQTKNITETVKFHSNSDSSEEIKLLKRRPTRVLTNQVIEDKSRKESFKLQTLKSTNIFNSATKNLENLLNDVGEENYNSESPKIRNKTLKFNLNSIMKDKQSNLITTSNGILDRQKQRKIKFNSNLSENENFIIEEKEKSNKDKKNNYLSKFIKIKANKNEEKLEVLSSRNDTISKQLNLFSGKELLKNDTLKSNNSLNKKSKQGKLDLINTPMNNKIRNESEIIKKNQMKALVTSMKQRTSVPLQILKNMLLKSMTNIHYKQFKNQDESAVDELIKELKQKKAKPSKKGIDSNRKNSENVTCKKLENVISPIENKNLPLFPSQRRNSKITGNLFKSQDNKRDSLKILNLLKLLPGFKRYMELNSISEEAVMKASEHLIYLKVKPGQYIFQEGDDADGFYCILSGKVQLTKNSFNYNKFSILTKKLNQEDEDLNDEESKSQNTNDFDNIKGNNEIQMNSKINFCSPTKLVSTNLIRHTNGISIKEDMNEDNEEVESVANYHTGNLIVNKPNIFAAILNKYKKKNDIESNYNRTKSIVGCFKKENNNLVKKVDFKSENCIKSRNNSISFMESSCSNKSNKSKQSCISVKSKRSDLINTLERIVESKDTKNLNFPTSISSQKDNSIEDKEKTITNNNIDDENHIINSINRQKTSRPTMINPRRDFAFDPITPNNKKRGAIKKFFNMISIQRMLKIDEKVKTLNSGDVFGDLGLLDYCKRNENAISLNDVELFKIDKDVFDLYFKVSFR